MEIITKKEIYNKMAQIMKLVFFINEKTMHDVFVRFSGHIDTCEITIHRYGWRPHLYGELLGSFDWFGNRDTDSLKFDGDITDSKILSRFDNKRDIDYIMDDMTNIEAKLLEIAKDENLDLTEIGM